MKAPSAAQQPALDALPWLRHAQAILALALPVMVARAGVLILVTVDTAMTGHAGATELAAYAVANAPLIPMMLFGIGLLSGTTVFAAQAGAAGLPREAGRVWRVALRQAALYGVVMAACVWLAGPALFRVLGQPDTLAENAAASLGWLALGLPAALMFTATSFYLESLGRAAVGVVVMALANVLNAGLNWLLIYGELGLPALGAEGACIATSAARWFTLGAVLLYVRLALDSEHHGLRESLRGSAELWSRLWRFGLPMGLSHAMETAAFAAMTLFAGWMGATVVAAFQVAFNLVALPFMLALGFTTAASVHVAAALGRGRPADALRAGVTATVLAALSLGSIGVAYTWFAAPLAGFYSADPELLALAVPTIAVAAWVLLPDGVQGTLMGALRGCRDVWPATGLYLFSFWGLMVPCGYLLGVEQGGGPTALMTATLIGVLAASLLLGARFTVVMRRLLRAAPGA